MINPVKLLNLLRTIHNVAGTLFKGKVTSAGVVALAVGGATTLISGENPFESARVIIDLCEKAWPHALIVFGAVTALMGYFRKAGADAVTTKAAE